MIEMMAVASAVLLASASGPTSLPAEADRFIKDHLQLTQYQTAMADLNDDGVAEVLVYANAPMNCGTGGCDLFILQHGSGSYRVVTDIGPTRLPIRILATTSHGWHDLAVYVAGGGIVPGYNARLTYDGASYPYNPTIPPATPLRKPAGRIVLSRTKN